METPWPRVLGRREWVAEAGGVALLGPGDWVLGELGRGELAIAEVGVVVRGEAEGGGPFDQAPFVGSEGGSFDEDAVAGLLILAHD